MEEPGSSQSTEQLEECPYRQKCTMNNVPHFRNYKHPHVEEFLEFLEDPDENKTKTVSEEFRTVHANVYLRILQSKSLYRTRRSSPKPETELRPETMLDRLEATKPYNIFFNAMRVLPETCEDLNTIFFTDLLCPSLGKLKASLQITFMAEMTWLITQYKLRNLEKLPLTVLDGEGNNESINEYIQTKFPNITHHHIELKRDIGCHHSKIGILLYEDNSLRVVVSTANLFFNDWTRYNNATWVSPRCHRLPESSRTIIMDDGESDTNFKHSLILYLRSYRLDCLDEWIDVVINTDFSSVRVFLLTSVPGFHHTKQRSPCHLLDMSGLLTRHCKLPPRTRNNNDGPPNWPILVQTSAVGSFGESSSNWLNGIFLQTLSKHTQGGVSPLSRPQLKVIYPSVDNVLNGVFDPCVDGTPLPYSKEVNEKQRWFQDFLYQWKADHTKRTHVMSHMKSYCRISPCSTKMAWFFLTSANLSRSGWGQKNRWKDGIQMISYEAGVLFFPQFFDEEYFEIGPQNDSGKKLFPLKFDLPLTAYRFCDYPYCNSTVEEEESDEGSDEEN